MKHVPVLLNEVVESLKLKPGMNVVDCTLGDGGHAEEILKLTSPDGILLGIDVDPEGLFRAKKFLYEYQNRIIFVRDNFANLKDISDREKFFPVNAVLLDLGWSVQQFKERGRGFSFEKDEKLDMRYCAGHGIETAADLLNNLSVEELERIFREYGEENLSREIAVAIAACRKEKRIETSGQLADIVVGVYRKKLKTHKEVPWIGGLNPATKVFQSLRIAVNDELGMLEAVLPQAIDILERGGRCAVISFHSLEDRVVKHFFRNCERKNKIRVITKKPITASELELRNNPASRSAKLRVAEKF